MPLPPYIKPEGNKVFFRGKGEIIYYIPEKYFDLNIAYFSGEYLEIMGIFVYSYSTDVGKTPSYYKHFKYPTMIRCIPSSIEKITNFIIPGSSSANDYRLAHMLPGTELLSDIEVAQSIDNVEKFVNLSKGGHLPSYIPYTEIHEYWIDNAKLNKFSYKVSNQILGIIISQICRDPEDLTKPFRYSKDKDMTAYKAININMIPKYTSAYTAFTSENPDEAIAAAITNKGSGKSPLEKIMMN